MKFHRPLNILCEIKFLKPALLAFVFVAAPLGAAAQPGNTAVEEMIRPKGGQTQKDTTRPNNNKGPKKGPKRGSNNPTGTIREPIRPANPLIEGRFRVVFNTGATGVEVLADGESIGVSDKNGKLTAFVREGEHQISARKYDQSLFEPIKINVSNKVTVFNVSENVAKGLDNVRPPAQNGNVEAADEKVEKVEPAGLPQPVDARGVLDNYADPEKSDSIKLEDWQIVYEQTRQKLQLGNTENDIEGLFAFAQGQIELSNKNMVKAVNALSAATVFLPTSPIVYYGLGNAHFVAGNENEAIAAYNKAIQLNAKFALAHKKLGDVYLAQDRTKEASAQYLQAKTLGMSTPELKLKIAETLIKNKDYEEAAKILEELEKEAPTAGVYVALSDCYIERERAVSAIEALNKAIAMEPNLPSAHYKIGVIYLKQKEFNKAKESLERAFTLDPEGKTVDRKELQQLIKKATKRSQ